MAVAVLWRNVHVDERETERQRGTVVEIGLDKLGPLRRNLARKFGIAVSGKVGKDDFGIGLAGPANFEKIDAAGAAGRGAGAGEFGVDESVDHAGFADVRAAEESDLRQAGSREVRGIGSRRHESCHHSHDLVCYGFSKLASSERR